MIACPNGHSFDYDEYSFCPLCGSEFSRSNSPQEGRHDEAVIDTRIIEVNARPEISSFGGNHRRIFNAVRSFAGQTLTSSDLSRIVSQFDPTFAPGSMLWNDHGAGNAGACRCAGTDARIFDQIRRGLYYVRISEV